MTHTPSPWVYDDDTATVSSERGVSVAGIDIENLDYEANACLIAAAPDLYQALYDLTNAVIEDMDTLEVIEDKMVDAASAALRKAEGREP